MTNIELQAYQAVITMVRHMTRIADALEAIVYRIDAAGVCADNPNEDKGEVYNG